MSKAKRIDLLCNLQSRTQLPNSLSHPGPKKDKRSNNDIQNTTQKAKDGVTRTPLKPWMNSVISCFSTSDNRRVFIAIIFDY